MTKNSDRDPAALPPRIARGDRWRRRSTGVVYEVGDPRPAHRDRIELRELRESDRPTRGRTYLVKPLDLEREFDRVTSRGDEDDVG